MSLIKDSEHLRIPYDDIKEATENFTTLIGRGGYGPVYRGQLSLSGELTAVAVKRLQTNRLSGQGRKEFLTEIQLLSRYKHHNLVSLVGFCEEPNEKFLIYLYAEHGSLDTYLKPIKASCPLTWKQRINICIDAARGLNHLHNHVAQNQRVIHRDIKSGNILLDHKWKAMIADFGFSKIGGANENDSYLITNPCGTEGYCDPAYIETGILTKESDIYSFGVVLFEVLCGRLSYKNVNNQERFLAPLVHRYYREGKLSLIIDRDLKYFTYSDSVKVFSEIAFQCLYNDRKRRPSMGLVLQELEKALRLLEMEQAPELLELEEALELKKLVETLQMKQFEEAWEMQELEEALGLHKLVETFQQHEFEEALKQREAWELQIAELPIDNGVIKAIYDMPNTPLSFITKDLVYSHLSNGILIDKGKVWLSINSDGKTQEMISAVTVMPKNGDYTMPSEPESRFSKIAEVCLPHQHIKVKIRTQFLSSDIKYSAYLVCKMKPNNFDEMGQYELRYTFNGTSQSYISYPSKIEDSEWWMFELFQTVNYKLRNVTFNVTFQNLHSANGRFSHLMLEGIQFLPSNAEKFVDDDDEIQASEVNNLSTSNIDSRLPNDFEKFMHSSNSKRKSTEEEAYSILSRGVPIRVNHQVTTWFWITKLGGKKCLRLPPTSLSYNEKLVKINRITSRDEDALPLDLLPSKVVGLRFEVPRDLLSTNTTYGCYLVYKKPRACTLKDTHDSVKISLDDGYALENFKFIYLNVPRKPVFGPHGLCGTTKPINKLKTIQLPRKRRDGWMEVNLGIKSDIMWMNMKQDKRFSHFWQRERTWRSYFLPSTSYNESCEIPNITIYMWPYSPHILHETMSPPVTPRLIMKGIEFRPV